MAYKNMKKNKKHVAEFKKDMNGWRRSSRMKKNALNKNKDKDKDVEPLTLENLEKEMKIRGLV